MPLVKPLPFLTQDRHSGIITVGTDAANFLSALQSPVVLVSIAGPGRTGKSFLANQILGRMDGFDVKPGLSACTRGVWLWPSAQHINVPTPNGPRRVSLLVLDCQGVKDDPFENRCFCIAAALSSAVVYSSLGALEEQQHEQLASLFTDTNESADTLGSMDAVGKWPLAPLSSSLSPHSQMHPLHQLHALHALHHPSSQLQLQSLLEHHAATPPLVIWALRDFSLALRDDRGAPMTAAQYLEASLRGEVRSVRDEYRRKVRGGRTGALVRRLLPRRDCVVLPRPVADEKLLGQLAHVHTSIWTHL